MPPVYGLELGLECHLLVLESLGKGLLGMTVLVFVSLIDLWKNSATVTHEAHKGESKEGFMVGMTCCFPCLLKKTNC